MLKNFWPGALSDNIMYVVL